ncbi:voltage gated chloride channel [Apiospora kogelbergensis]|uniref:voltage gated chloride channel n=1 Tax=Apiospora kogelbergensis TaxID=1337665 RepID=UPI00312CC9B7
MASRNLISGDPGAATPSTSTSSSSSSHAATSNNLPRSPLHQQHDNFDDDEENDDIDFLDPEEEEDTGIFENDPLDEEPISFKRKQKQSVLVKPARLLSAITGNRLGGGTTQSPARSPHNLSGANTPSRLQGLDTSRNGVPVDWYQEGPGRRVGYEDMTAIDWIFEYTKERQRLRALYSSASGVLGYVQQLLDASQVWVVLVLTGLAVGALAAAIGVTTDWLGDVKVGYCSSGKEGGAFYLNKDFCCLGYDQGEKCLGWRPWATALGVGNAGGRWFVGYFFYILFAVTFALCSSILVQEYGIYAKHSGIPEIKTVLGGFIIKRFLGVWTLVTKSLGLILATGSGMWLGKEGPLVHVACCCANLFIKLFPNINNNEARKREVLSAAAASGISVAFGSPIGGVLFSLEQLSYYFPDKTMWQSFVCAMTAAVMVQAIDPFRSGQLVLYQVKYTSHWHGFEIVPFAILGVVGGIYGGLFIKANMRVAQWKKSTNLPLPGPLVQVGIVAFLTALINYPNFYMRAQNSDLVSQLFSQCSQMLDDQFGLCKTGAATAGTIILLLFAAVLGFFLASITFGLQIPAGIILPSMAIGALTGRALGIIMEIWQHNHPGFIAFASCEPDIPCITPGTYAIIGAAAALAGVTRLTVSIVVITFELTGALTYVLPIMVAVMLAKWVGDAFSRRGIYESWIHFSGYPFLDNGDDGAGRLHVPDIPAGQIMTRIEDLVVLTATGHTVGSLRRVLESCDYRGFPVVRDPRDALLLGYISRAELAYNLASAVQPPRSLPPEAEAFFSHQPLADPVATLDLRPWMDQTPLTLPARSSLHLAVSYFQKLGVRYVLFVERGSLVGVLTKKDCWYVLNGADETRRTAGGAGGGAGGRDGDGVGDRTREMGEEVEERGLLGRDSADDDELEEEGDDDINRSRSPRNVGGRGRVVVL